MSKKLKIGHLRYVIREVDGSPLADSWGLLDAERTQIIINRRVSDDRYFGVVNHEALHGMLEVCGLDKHFETEEEEETFILTLTPIFAGYIRDNYKLLGEMLKRKGDFNR